MSKQYAKSPTVVAVTDLPDAVREESSEYVPSFFDAMNPGVALRPSEDSHPLYFAEKQLDKLYTLGKNWNGYDVSAPHPEAIPQAKRWLETLYDEVVTDNESRWMNPHVTANEEGDIVFEWSRSGSKLVVYVSVRDAFYIKAWGPSVATEMSDGDANTPQERLPLLQWFRKRV